MNLFCSYIHILMYKYQQSDSRLFIYLGPVVGKPVNVNPGLKVNWRSYFSPIKVLSTTFVLCSLRLSMLKTKGQKI